MHPVQHVGYISFKKEKKALTDPTQLSGDNFFRPAKSADSVEHPHSQCKQKLLTTSLVDNVIVKCGLPVSIVDNVHFRKFLAELDPRYATPCRQTVTRTVIPQLVEDKRNAVRSFLDSVSSAALTVDIWTDRRAHSFIGITVHAYNPLTGDLMNKLLKFKSFKGSHTGQHIAEAIEATITEHNLVKKVNYIVTDNASNMRKAMSFVFASETVEEHPTTADTVDLADDENAFADVSLWNDTDDDDVKNAVDSLGTRVACFAHSLQLVVRDGLNKTGAARPALAKCSKLANIIHQSSSLCTAFQEEFGQRSIPAVNDTRWNSMYAHLKAIISFDNARLTDVLNKSSHGVLVLSAKDVQVLTELVNILEPFAEATDLTQGDKAVTISCVVPVLVSLNRLLSEFSGICSS